MEIPRITIYKKEDFRKWLQKYHNKESKVAVVLHKRHTGKSAPSHRELMEEAICFGWIDTTIKRIDEDTFLRHFSKRTTNSTWSNNTISYAKRLIKEGKMAVQGLHFYTLGLAKPTHDFGIPKDPPIPEELKIALSKNTKARKKFETWSPSLKRTYYRWILRAKQPATKEKRIKRLITNILNDKKSVF